MDVFVTLCLLLPTLIQANDSTCLEAEKPIAVANSKVICEDEYCEMECNEMHLFPTRESYVEFECVDNQWIVGNEYTECQEQVDHPPQILVHPSDMVISHVDFDNGITLNCNASGYPVPDIRWYKDGEYLYLECDYVLHIQPVRLEDAGTYKCKAENVFGVKESKSATLQVTVPSKIVTLDEEFWANYGKYVKLPCKAVGGPTPDIRWTVNGEHLNTDGNRIHDFGSHLQIKDLSRADAGEYTCHAENIYGADTVTHTLHVQSPPHPPGIQPLSATANSIEVKLKPSILHDDIPADGYIIHIDSRGYHSRGYRVPTSAQNYTLDSLFCGRKYKIEASAYNKIGYGERSEFIYSHTKGSNPEVPEVQDIVEASSTSITLHLKDWGDGGCPISYFFVQYKSRNQDDWIMSISRMARADVEPAGYVIMELTPATWYRLRITVYNDAGHTVAEYDTATLTVTGETVSPESFELGYEDGGAYYTMGAHTLWIPMSLHQENRERLVKRLQARTGYVPSSVVLLQGGEDTHRSGSGDVNNVFRQESYFHWAFGVLEPGWYGAIDVSSGRTTLFMPRHPQKYAMWMGQIRTPEEYQRQYQVDEVRYVDEMAQVLEEVTSGELLTLHGINTDSGKNTLQATFEGISQFTVNNNVLHDEIAECRVHKSEAEIRVLRYAASVACAAHRSVMRRIRPGMKEYQLEAMFQNHTYYNGCRHQGYTNICGSGPNAAVLHYGHAGAPNDRTIKDGDTIMVDMGAEYYSYTSDVSVSYPANGKFSDDHKIIYNAVYAAHQAVLAALQPGVSWVEMQRLAYRAMLEKLKEAGLVQGGIDEMMAANIGSVFMPHGLGHLLGIDVHDVGGYMEGHPSRPTETGFSSLRTARIIEENMVLTVEPGCYFIDYIIDGAFANPEQAQFLVPEEIERFRGFGGVRIEDDVLITANGIDNLSQDLPRTVESIEELMASGREEENVHVV